jgi:hypothetical protein
VATCQEVFCLPSISADKTFPFALAIIRRPVIRKSRATTVVAAHAGTAFSGTSEINAAATLVFVSPQTDKFIFIDLPPPNP